MSLQSLIYMMLRKDGWSYFFGILGLVIIDILLLGVPKIIGLSIDSISHKDANLTHYILIFIAVLIGITGLKFVTRHLFLGSVRRFEYYMRNYLFRHSLEIPVSYYEQNGPGKVMALMTNDTISIRVALGLGVIILVDAIFFGIFAFLIMGHVVSYRQALITLSPMILIVSVTLFINHFMRKAQREAQNTFSDMTEFVQELFLGMPVIRAFNKEILSLKEFRNINQRNYERNMKVAFLDSIVGPLTFIAPFTCFALNIYLSGLLIASGAISIGDFVEINGYLILLIGPLMGLGSLATITQKGLASMDRIKAFLVVTPEHYESHTGHIGHADIHIKALSFSYPDTDYLALKDITMDIPYGSFIGIVGAPGSGKSTLLKLLLRLQNPPKGEIFFDERDVLSIPIEQLRRSISYIPQTSYILSSTVKDNITFGNQDIVEDEEQVYEAARRAYLTMDLGDRLASQHVALKEQGSDLSGGQKQRVNIARAFYKDASYVFLDDSFSALDFHSAREILNHLRSEKKQTIIFVSQRLEALTDADCIYVFNNGAISESGTHESLYAKGGEYFTLYSQQISKNRKANTNGTSTIYN